jgi:hypothetical protein
LPLQAKAGGVKIIRAKAKAAADKVPKAIFIDLLHTVGLLRRFNMDLIVFNSRQDVNDGNTKPQDASLCRMPYLALEKQP